MIDDDRSKNTHTPFAFVCVMEMMFILFRSRPYTQFLNLQTAQHRV